jgi:hypothetical protein
MNEQEKRLPLWVAGALFLAYAAIAVCATWPQGARLFTDLPRGTDTLEHYWNGWWAWQALRNLQSPYHTSYLFYPAGISLVYNNLAWLHMLPWVALRPLVGGIAAYNLIFLVHLALCGLAMFLLAYDLTRNVAAAFLAGLIYECWPYRMTQPSHPNLMSTWPIALFMLFLVRTLRRGRWQDGLLAGASLALVAYTRWQLLIPALVVASVYLVLTLPRVLGRRPLSALALGGGVTALALAPPALLFVHEYRANPADLVIESEETMMQTDLLAYVTPASRHPLLGGLTRAAYQRYYADRGSRSEFSVYVGVVALALLGVGIGSRPRRRALPWIGMAVVLVLLALGPVLRVNGRLYPAIPMPYRLAARLFVVRLLRGPERFNMSLALPVAVLAAYGAGYLVSRIRRRGTWAVPAFALFAGGAVFFEYLVVPFPLQPAQVSEFYSRLAAEPGDFAILNLPIDPYNSKPYMFAQTVHQHPILQGHTSRYPTGVFAYLDGQRWLRSMRQHSQVPPPQADLSRELAALAGDGIRYLIVHKEMLSAERWAGWRRYLAITPVYEDAEIAVYRTAPAAGRDFILSSELVPGVGIVDAVVAVPCTNAGHALAVDVAWGAASAPGRDLDAELALVSRDGGTLTAGTFPLNEDWPSSQWPANAVAWGRYALSLPADLPTGSYDVMVTLVDPETAEQQGQAAAVGEVYVSPTPCSFEAPPGVVNVNALFGDAMRLPGYRLEQGKDELTLVLYWRPERRMDVDYKVFVHVFDPASGIPVAQDDAMPLRWTYPTSLWGLGETVTDEIQISLQAVPPGTYGVAVGVYDPASAERLAVVDGSGQQWPDGRLVLQGETVEVAERLP